MVTLSKMSGRRGGHSAEAAPCSCLSMGLSVLGLLACEAMRAPEGVSSWRLVITGKLHQLFLHHGSSVAVLLHRCLGRCLLCDKRQLLLALNTFSFQSNIGVQCCSEQRQGAEQSMGWTTTVGFGSCHISWPLASCSSLPFHSWVNGSFQHRALLSPPSSHSIG